ncbi:hypothetical protein MMC20_004177 [Loxospora ochrophaea]|nr:hypothetical protein [Loxospora ochrophaea]
MAKLGEMSTVGGERTDAVDHCLAGIARLSYEVKDASSYIPAYDQRTYGEAIKALSAKLEETRASFAPRPKFTFKTTHKNNSAISLQDAAELASAQRRHIPGYCSYPNSNESSLAPTPAYLATPPNETSASSTEPTSEPSALQPASSSPNLDPRTAAIRKPSFATSTSVSISSHTNLHIILPSSASHATSSGSLTSLRHCVVDMSVPTTASSSSPSQTASQTQPQPFAGLTIKNVKESLLVCGSVSGAAHITDVEDSVLVITTRQFRMHECRNCVVYLHCSSKPIIEDCSGIRFAPLPKPYNLTPTPLSSTPNLYNQVDDFKWLKAEHSPNWSLLAPEDTIVDEVWRDIVPGGPGWSLADILKATGVTR